MGVSILVSLIFFIPVMFQVWVLRKQADGTTIAAQKINQIFAFLLVLVVALNFIHQEIRQPTLREFGIFLVSVIYLFWVRGTAVNKSRGIEIKPADRFKMSARSFLGMAALYLIYFSVVALVSIKFSLFAGVPLGILAVYFSTPVALRMMWKTSPIEDPAAKEVIASAFQCADISLNRIYFIEMNKVKFHNAMVCGPKWGFGPFQRSLFITKSLFENLSAEETRAVLLHEASHFKLKHLGKRMIAVLCGWGLTLAMVQLLTAANLYFFHQMVSLFVVFGFIMLVQSQVIGHVARKHEFEADLEAVKMGASGPALISALKKITELAGLRTGMKYDWLSRLVLGVVHPSIEEREATLLRGSIEKNETRLPVLKYAATFTLLAALQLGISSVNQNRTDANRNPASSER